MMNYNQQEYIYVIQRYNDECCKYELKVLYTFDEQPKEMKRMICNVVEELALIGYDITFESSSEKGSYKYAVLGNYDFYLNRVYVDNIFGKLGFVRIDHSTVPSKIDNEHWYYYTRVRENVNIGYSQNSMSI